ncbi:MAG: MarR family transcriptional regulator [Proteobacteria bacterium]|nr:MarR family transcriptional regulator [Pseudomonadota bacterium]
MFDLSRYLPYLINRTGRKLAAIYGRELRNYGIDIQEWRVLAVLQSHGDQRLIDLAALTSIDVSTLSRLVTRMVGAGLVQRTRGARDGRSVQVSLTERSRRIVLQLVPKARSVERAALNGMSTDEVEQLKQHLSRIQQNLGAVEP